MKSLTTMTNLTNRKFWQIYKIWHFGFDKSNAFEIFENLDRFDKLNRFFITERCDEFKKCKWFIHLKDLTNLTDLKKMTDIKNLRNFIDLTFLHIKHVG